MTSKLFVTSVMTLGLLAALGAPALAHHGNAAYDDKITEFKNATVTKFNWANPHALIDFDAKDAKGNPVHMVVETAAPQALTDAGVDHKIETYPAKHGWVLRDTPVYDAAAAERHWNTLLALFGGML